MIFGERVKKKPKLNGFQQGDDRRKLGKYSYEN